MAKTAYLDCSALMGELLDEFGVPSGMTVYRF